MTSSRVWVLVVALAIATAVNASGGKTPAANVGVHANEADSFIEEELDVDLEQAANEAEEEILALEHELFEDDDTPPADDEAKEAGADIDDAKLSVKVGDKFDLEASKDGGSVKAGDVDVSVGKDGVGVNVGDVGVKVGPDGAEVKVGDVDVKVDAPLAKMAEQLLGLGGGDGGEKGDGAEPPADGGAPAGGDGAEPPGGGDGAEPPSGDGGEPPQDPSGDGGEPPAGDGGEGGNEPAKRERKRADRRRGDRRRGDRRRGDRRRGDRRRGGRRRGGGRR